MTRSELIRASWNSWMTQSARPAGPAWWQLVWTFLFSMAVAAGFTIVGFVLFARGDSAWRNVSGWGQWYLNYLIVSLAIGYSIHGLFYIGGRLLGQARIATFTRGKRISYYTLVPACGVVLGNAVGLPLIDRQQSNIAVPTDWNARIGSLLIALLLLIMFQVFFSLRHRRIAAERRAAQAQLQLLQAQMEPHFLFNTLANVVGLMDIDTPRAKAMLESFTDYLRASLISLRTPEHSLGNELALVEAYLRVAQVRMDDRLRYRIDVPDALRDARVPALGLQPLVENAVIHGLEPSIDGGCITVTAQRRGDLLELRVVDDGVGLPSTARPAVAGHGSAVANIRERIAQGDDARAELRLEPAPPHGVQATLILPYTTGTAR
ncbi:MAG: histidine kinase [Caldimonas sp.]